MRTFDLGTVACPTCPTCPTGPHRLALTGEGRVRAGSAAAAALAGGAGEVLDLVDGWFPVAGTRSNVRAWRMTPVRVDGRRWRAEPTLLVEVGAEEHRWFAAATAHQVAGPDGLLLEHGVSQGRVWLAATGAGGGVVVSLPAGEPALLAALAASRTATLVPLREGQPVPPEWARSGFFGGPLPDPALLPAALVLPMTGAPLLRAQLAAPVFSAGPDLALAQARIRAEADYRAAILSRPTAPSCAGPVRDDEVVVEANTGWWSAERSALLVAHAGTRCDDLVAAVLDALGVPGPGLARTGPNGRLRSERVHWCGPSPVVLDAGEAPLAGRVRGAVLEVVAGGERIAVRVVAAAPAYARGLASRSAPALLCAPSALPGALPAGTALAA